MFSLVLNQRFQTLAKWLVLASASIYLFLFTDTLKALSLIENINFVYFFSFMLLGFSNRFFNSLRILQVCNLLTDAHRLKLASSLRISLFSEFISVLVPTTYSAEAVRIFQLSKYKLSFKYTSLAVVIDRSFGLLVMCLITLVIFGVSDILSIDALIITPRLYSIFIITIIAVVIFSGFLLIYFKTSFLKWLHKFKNIFSFNRVKTIFVTSLLVYASAIGSYYFAYMASGVEITIVHVIFIVFLSFIATLIPISILGITAGEFVLVVVSEYFRVSHEQALMTAMIVILGKYIFSCIGLLFEIYCDGIAVVSDSLKVSAKNI